MENNDLEIINGSLSRIAQALEDANKIHKDHLRYAIDRDRVSFDFMKRREQREVNNSEISIITGDKS